MISINGETLLETH